MCFGSRMEAARGGLASDEYRVFTVSHPGRFRKNGATGDGFGQPSQDWVARTQS